MRLLTALMGCSLLALANRAWGSAEIESVVTLQASKHAHSSLSPDDHFRASATMDFRHRAVRIVWKFASDSDFGKPADLDLVQKFAVSYIPTAVEFANPDRIIVSGRLARATVVEVWHLQRPRMIVAIPPEGGEPTSILVGQQRVSVQLIYRDDQSSTPGARTLIHNRGKPRSTFVIFNGSHDVCELSWPEGPGLGTPVVRLSLAQYPALAAANYNAWFGGEHVTDGYIYHLSVHQQLDLHDSFVFIDSDKDGVIDSVESWDFADFEDHKATDITSWLDYAGQEPPL